MDNWFILLQAFVPLFFVAFEAWWSVERTCRLRFVQSRNTNSFVVRVLYVSICGAFLVRHPFSFDVERKTQSDQGRSGSAGQPSKKGEKAKE